MLKLLYCVTPIEPDELQINAPARFNIQIMTSTNIEQIVEVLEISLKIGGAPFPFEIRNTQQLSFDEKKDEDGKNDENKTKIATKGFKVKSDDVLNIEIEIDTSDHTFHLTEQAVLTISGTVDPIPLDFSYNFLIKNFDIKIKESNYLYSGDPINFSWEAIVPPKMPANTYLKYYLLYTNQKEETRTEIFPHSQNDGYACSLAFETSKSEILNFKLLVCIESENEIIDEEIIPANNRILIQPATVKVNEFKKAIDYDEKNEVVFSWNKKGKIDHYVLSYAGKKEQLPGNAETYTVKRPMATTTYRLQPYLSSGYALPPCQMKIQVTYPPKKILPLMSIKDVTAIQPKSNPRFLFVAVKNEVQLIDFLQQDVLKRISIAEAKDEIRCLALDEKNNRLYAGVYDAGKVYVINTENYEIIKSISVGKKLSSLVLDSENRILFAGGKIGIYVIRAADYQLVYYKKISDWEEPKALLFKDNNLYVKKNHDGTEISKFPWQKNEKEELLGNETSESGGKNIFEITFITEAEIANKKEEKIKKVKKETKEEIKFINFVPLTYKEYQIIYTSNQEKIYAIFEKGTEFTLDNDPLTTSAGKTITLDLDPASEDESKLALTQDQKVWDREKLLENTMAEELSKGDYGMFFPRFKKTDSSESDTNSSIFFSTNNKIPFIPHK